MRAAVPSENRKIFCQKIFTAALVTIILFTFINFRRIVPGELRKKNYFRHVGAPAYTGQVGIRATVLWTNRNKFCQKICTGMLVTVVLYTFISYRKIVPRELREKNYFCRGIFPTYTSQVRMRATVLWTNRNKFCRKICTGKLVSIVLYTFINFRRIVPGEFRKKNFFRQGGAPAYTGQVGIRATVLWANRNKFCQKFCTIFISEYLYPNIVSRMLISLY